GVAHAESDALLRRFLFRRAIGGWGVYASRFERYAVLCGKFCGIAEEVEESLPDLGAVGENGAAVFGAIDLQPVAILFDQRLDSRRDFLSHALDDYLLDEQGHFSRLDFREIQDVVDEREEVFPGRANFLQIRG